MGLTYSEEDHCDSHNLCKLLALYLCVTTQLAGAACTIGSAVYTGSPVCPDGVGCEPMRCAWEGGQPPCTNLPACQCANIQCECEGGALVNVPTCWNSGMCNPCQYTRKNKSASFLARLVGRTPSPGPVCGSSSSMNAGALGH